MHKPGADAYARGMLRHYPGICPIYTFIKGTVSRGPRSNWGLRKYAIRDGRAVRWFPYPSHVPEHRPRTPSPIDKSPNAAAACLSIGFENDGTPLLVYPRLNVALALINAPSQPLWFPDKIQIARNNIQILPQLSRKLSVETTTEPEPERKYSNLSENRTEQRKPFGTVSKQFRNKQYYTRFDFLSIFSNSNSFVIKKKKRIVNPSSLTIVLKWNLNVKKLPSKSIFFFLFPPKSIDFESQQSFVQEINCLSLVIDFFTS